METAGALSGAVLGYTAGNIPGAYMGYKVGKYLGKRRRATKSYTKNKKRRLNGTFNKKSIALEGTTRQKDDRLLYVKRRMPKGKRRVWKKFVKKVHAVEITDRGLQTIKYNQNGVISSNVPALGQVYKAVHLYGAGATAGEPGSRDLNQLGLDVQVQGANWIKRVGGDINMTIPTTANKIEIRMQSATLDTYIKNTGSITLLFEVYHLWYVKNNSAPSFGDASGWVESKEDIKQEWDGTTLTPLTQVGLTGFNTTLFDESQFISKLGCTIKSMREIYLEPGQVHHMQIRDSKNHNINLFNYVLQEGVNYQGYVDPKLTESYVIVAKNIDNSIEGQFTTNACRTYRYTIEGVKQPAAGRKSLS